VNLCGCGSPHKFWTDDLDPWIVRVGPTVGISWYGVAYCLSLAAATVILSRWTKEGRLPIVRSRLYDLLAYGTILVLVGGRLGYLLGNGSFGTGAHLFEAFAFWHGGMSSVGGIAGVFVSIVLIAKGEKIPYFVVADAVAAVVPIGFVFVRLANFVNGELWGRASCVPWAVIFPSAPAVGGVNHPRHPSQLYAVVLEGLLVLTVTQIAFHRQSRAGLTSSVACVAYGAGRFVDEFWRQPEPGAITVFGWMTSAQCWMLILIAVGVGLGVLSVPKRRGIAA
jgi:phosphatidylglycerol---prolipoprotein diacylglyceryl transferase